MCSGLPNINGDFDWTGFSWAGAAAFTSGCGFVALASCGGVVAFDGRLRACSICAMLPNTSGDFDWTGFSWAGAAAFTSGCGFVALASCGGVVAFDGRLRACSICAMLPNTSGDFDWIGFSWAGDAAFTSDCGFVAL